MKGGHKQGLGARARLALTGVAVAAAGVAGAAHAGLQSILHVLLVLGAFLALALSRAPQRP